jgi:lysophospholipase L1-like esterase
MLASAKTILAWTSFWVMLPISAIQGLRLKKTAIRLPEAEGDKHGACGVGKQFHLLAIGDSIIAGVGTGTMSRSLPVQFAAALATSLERSVHWRVDGSNGADILFLQKQIQRLDGQQQADLILISIGVNDVTGLSSKRHWAAQLEILTTALRSKWPQACVIFVGLPPMARFPLPPQPLRYTLGQRASALDDITASFIAKQSNMLHIPTLIDPTEQEFCEDGFHPSAQACGAWAKQLAQRIKSDTFSA